MTASQDHLPHLGNCPTLRISHSGSSGACSLSLAGTVNCPPQLVLLLNIGMCPKTPRHKAYWEAPGSPGGHYVIESISQKGLVGLSSLLSDLQGEQLVPP